MGDVVNLTLQRKSKIDYTLEQFLAEVKHREGVIRTLERITNTLEKLDKRLEKLEDAKR